MYLLSISQRWSLELGITGVLVQYFITKEDKELATMDVLYLLFMGLLWLRVEQSSTDPNRRSHTQINGEGFIRKGFRCKKHMLNRICGTSDLFRLSAVATPTGAADGKKQTKQHGICYLIILLLLSSSFRTCFFYEQGLGFSYHKSQ